MHIHKMPKKHPYTCPRCEYFTSKKPDMYKHLHKLLKPCPAIHQDIVLTDEIKQYILDNRVYRPPKQTEHQVINQQINNYQLVVNYINKKDFQDKITQYLEYTKENLQDYTNTVEQHYQNKLDKLESEGFRQDRTLTCDALIDVLDTCTSSQNVHKMNLMYDKVLDKLQIYEDEWTSHHFEAGVQELISSIQCVYLDKYEEYLLKQYNDASMFDRQCIEEALTEYYQFLETFDAVPYIKTSQEAWIHDIQEGYIGKVYNKVKDEMKGSVQKTIKKRVFNVIKTNCHQSLLELNKQMMELIKMDETFKNNIMNELKNAVHI
jgi:hypothetical protein